MFTVRVAWCLSLATISSCHYDIGLCRTHLVDNIYNTSVTLSEIAADGDYAVLYTSGLKQYDHVDCATIRYNHATYQGFYFNSYARTSKQTEIETYEVREINPGKLGLLSSTSDEVSQQYIVYHQDGVLLVYWCKDKEDDHYFHNIWLIAALAEQADSPRTKRAVLQMLYHEDYRPLIDRDLEETREESARYLRLAPCRDQWQQ